MRILFGSAKLFGQTLHSNKKWGQQAKLVKNSNYFHIWATYCKYFIFCTTSFCFCFACGQRERQKPIDCLCLYLCLLSQLICVSISMFAQSSSTLYAHIVSHSQALPSIFDFHFIDDMRKESIGWLTGWPVYSISIMFQGVYMFLCVHTKIVEFCAIRNMYCINTNDVHSICSVNSV